MTEGLAPDDMFDVAFVGRANIDLTVHVPHRARPGRTAVGSSLTARPGGKSLNQAITAARAGGRTCLVTNVGGDTWGHQIADALVHEKVDTRHLTVIPDATTGAAVIEVTPDGESYITLALSPPTELTAHHILHATADLHATVTVVQLDLPTEPVTVLLQHRPGPILIGNLIPHPDHTPDLLRHLDVLVVNHHEATAILHTTTHDALDAATALHRLGPRTVVVTAGPHGAAYTNEHTHGTIPAPTVPVVDTTGAGDAFLGRLALALARHTPLPEAVTTAVHAGAETVQQSGATTRSHDR
ncbi:ribokinase [Micromonospora sp. SH-82]|uniref:ribokinase n=1 Tax=Micromonospora sp. SH-82 TaxID=3132938 RepID=UPI003EC14EA4